MTQIFKIIRRSIVIVILVAFIVVLTVLKKNPDICEAFTRTVARGYGYVASAISSVVPFSLTELMFAILAVSLVILLVLAIISLVKFKPFAAINRVLEGVIIVLITIGLYDFSCELAYNRKEMPLLTYEEKVENTEFIDIYNAYANDLNYCISQLEFLDNGDVKQPMDLNGIAKEVKKAYDIINDNPYFHPHFGSVKPMASSFVYREFQITGVTYSPFGESNINVLNTFCDIPFTVAHEISHTKGVMKEDNANMLAFLVCLNSDNCYLRYSAYVRYFDQIRAIVNDRYLPVDQRGGESLVKVDKAYYKTYSYVGKYWDEHDLLGKIGDFINDLYIKNSGVEEGTSSYHSGETHEFDETTYTLYPSPYQKMYFYRYYNVLSV